jgi:hypothetical protein
MLRQPGGSPLIFSTIFEKLERARPTPGSTFVWGSEGGSDEGAAVDLFSKQDWREARAGL